jgi:DNA-binding transcriptional regulator YiaG
MNGKHKTKDERAAQDAQIARYRADYGLTFAQIAKEMHISMDTAWKGYGRFMTDFAKHHHSDQKVLLSEYHSRMEQSWRAHIAKYRLTIDKETGVGDIRIMREAARLQSEAFDRLQSAGLLPTIKKNDGEIALSGDAKKLKEFLFGEEKKKT